MQTATNHLSPVRNLRIEETDLQIHTRNGILTVSRSQVKLSEAGGQINRMEGDTYQISAKGARHLNKFAGLTLIAPPLYVDGVKQTNPYSKVHPRTGAVERVVIRKIALGLNITGNLVAIDHTLNFVPYTYFMEELFERYNACRDVGVMGFPTHFPHAPARKPKKIPGTDEYFIIHNTRQWVYKQIDPGMGIWFNINHPEFQEALGNYIKYQKSGERIAEGIVTRNVITSHPAVGVKETAAEDGIAIVPVYCVRHSLKKEDVIDFSNDDFHRHDVETHTEAGEIESTDFRIPEAAPDTGSDPADREPGAGDAPSPQPARDHEADRHRDTIRRISRMKSLDPNDFSKRMFRCANWENLNASQLAQLEAELKTVGTYK